MSNTRTPIKVSDRVKWADPAVARDLWDPDRTPEENLKEINNALNTLHVVTDIKKDIDGRITMIELDYGTEIPPREAFRTSAVLSLNTDPQLLQESLTGAAIINIGTKKPERKNTIRRTYKPKTYR